MKVQTELPSPSDDLENLYREMPLKYRFIVKLLLKLPNPSIPSLVLKRAPFLEGIIAGLILPLLVYLMGIATLWLFVVTTLAIGFPLNYIIVLIPPTIIFIIFIRIQLKRTINLWRSVFGSPTVWDSAKSLDELMELFKKQQNKIKK